MSTVDIYEAQELIKKSGGIAQLSGNRLIFREGTVDKPGDVIGNVMIGDGRISHYALTAIIAELTKRKDQWLELS